MSVRSTGPFQEGSVGEWTRRVRAEKLRGEVALVGRPCVAAHGCCSAACMGEMCTDWPLLDSNLESKAVLWGSLCPRSCSTAWQYTQYTVAVWPALARVQHSSPKLVHPQPPPLCAPFRPSTRHTSARQDRQVGATQRPAPHLRRRARSRSSGLLPPRPALSGSLTRSRAKDVDEDAG